MNILVSKNGRAPFEIAAERTEYVFCLRCRTVNRIDVERRYGILQEFHENGACLIRHPNWLIGRYPTIDEAQEALYEKLSDLARRSAKKHFWLGTPPRGDSPRWLQ
jgi:hypothetical protein